jgi:hypothetical protein
LTALTAKAALVDPATFEDGNDVIVTSIPRSEIEEALKADAASELYLDVARDRDGQREAEQRITVSWETEDLERLLQSTPGDEVTFAFKPDELARMFEEPDVEAQGLREKMAVLTIAATTAAGISAGVASAMVANPVAESGGGGGATAAFVTDTTSSGPAAEAGTVSNLVTDTTSSAGPAQEGLTPAQQLAALEATGETPSGSQFLTDATSSGPQAVSEAGTVSNLVTDTTSSAGPAQEGLTPAQQLTALESTGGSSSGGQFLTDATSSGPQATTEAASATGGGQSFIQSRGGEAALAGGLMLLILGAGFVGSRQRRTAQPA